MTEDRLSNRHSFTSFGNLSAVQRSSDAVQFILANFGVKSAPLKKFSEINNLNLEQNDSSNLFNQFFMVPVKSRSGPSESGLKATP